MKPGVSYRPDTQRHVDMPTTPVYDQAFVNGLKDEIEHWKRLCRNQLVIIQDLRKKEAVKPDKDPDT